MAEPLHEVTVYGETEPRLMSYDELLAVRFDCPVCDVVNLGEDALNRRCVWCRWPTGDPSAGPNPGPGRDAPPIIQTATWHDAPQWQRDAWRSSPPGFPALRRRYEIAAVDLPVCPPSGAPRG